MLIDFEQYLKTILGQEVQGVGGKSGMGDENRRKLKDWVQSGYDIHKYSQWVSTPLQGLILTAGVISSPH